MNRDTFASMTVSLLGGDGKYDGRRSIIVKLKHNNDYLIVKNDNFYLEKDYISIYKEDNYVYKIPYASMLLLKFLPSEVN